MAETLAEIYNGTLTEADFTNGEATIITTNSTTSHVIKDMKVVQGVSNIPVVGDLKVGNFPIASLSYNASGTEIIGPNSTVKVATNSFPPAYADLVFQFQESTDVIKNMTFPKIGSLDAAPVETSSTNISNIPYRTTDTSSRKLFTGIGPNNYTVVIFNDLNSSTSIYVVNSSGTTLFSNTSSYSPKWFDGTRYAYWLPQGTSVYKLDTWTALTTTINLGNTANPSTYPKMFGQTGKYAVFWPDYTATPVYYLNLATDVVGRVSNNSSASTLFSVDAKNYYLADLNSGFKVVRNSNQNTLRLYDWTPGSLLTSSANYEDVSLPVNIAQENESQVLLGNTFYYSDTSRNLQAYNLDTRAITNLGAIANTQVYGYDVWYKLVTPDSTTVANRSYTLNPSLSLRLTGVTSTQG